MNIQNTIEELRMHGIINGDNIEFIPFSGGTTSTIGWLKNGNNNRLVLKFNEPETLRQEALFLQAYKKITYLPELLYHAKDYTYIVYPFLEGSTSYTENDKAATLISLTNNLFNHYSLTDKQGWGFSSDLCESREQFLHNELQWANRRIGSFIEDQEDLKLLADLIQRPSRNTITSSVYLLHGDCGYHNFLFSNGHLSAVIDPQPFIGHPLLDLIFAFCSTPKQLTKETILTGACQLNSLSISEQVLYEEVLIGLYTRIGICSVHHPQDLPEYFNAWKQWKKIVLANSF